MCVRRCCRLETTSQSYRTPTARCCRRCCWCGSTRGTGTRRSACSRSSARSVTSSSTTPASLPLVSTMMLDDYKAAYNVLKCSTSEIVSLLQWVNSWLSSFGRCRRRTDAIRGDGSFGQAANCCTGSFGIQGGVQSAQVTIVPTSSRTSQKCKASCARSFVSTIPRQK